MFVRRVLKKSTEAKKIFGVTKRNAGGHHHAEPATPTTIALKGVEGIDPFATNYTDLSSLATPLYDPKIASKAPENIADLEYQANTEISTSQLENGMKIISTDSHYKAKSVVSLFVNAGSRFETFSNNGVSHFVQRFLYAPTNQRSYLRVATELQKTGAEVSAQAGREEIVYRSESLRDAVPKTWSVIANSVLQSRLLDWDMPPKREAVQTDLDLYAESPELILNEALHQAAFGNKTLGRSLVCPSHNVHAIKASQISDYMNTFFRPDRMTLVGTNINHADLVAIGKELFGSVETPVTTVNVEASRYVGGDVQVGDRHGNDAYAAVAFQGARKGDADYYTLQVLAALLGDSTTPAVYTSNVNGRNSVLFQKIITQIPTIERAKAFSTSYSDNGLFGVFVQGSGKIDEAINGGIAAIKTIAAGEVTPALVEAAKRRVIAQIASSLECGSGLNEFVAKNSGKDLYSFVSQVNQVDAAKVSQAAQKVLKSRPSVASYGNLESVPTTSDLKI